MSISTPASNGFADLNTLRAGDIISMPTAQFRVETTEFERDDAFPEAVAQVAIEFAADSYPKRTHIRTPFGFVMVIADDRGF